MNKAIGYGSLAIVLFVAGFAGGWVARGTSAGHDVAHLELMRGLEDTFHAANALRLVQGEHPERLPELLWRDLDQGLDGIERGLAGGARLETAAPNLREALERAEDVAARTTRTAVAERARALRAKLGGTT